MEVEFVLKCTFGQKYSLMQKLGSFCGKGVLFKRPVMLTN